jgi:hypothetical protein
MYLCICKRHTIKYIFMYLCICKRHTIEIFLNLCFLKCMRARDESCCIKKHFRFGGRGWVHSMVELCTFAQQKYTSLLDDRRMSHTLQKYSLTYTGNFYLFLFFDPSSILIYPKPCLPMYVHILDTLICVESSQNSLPFLKWNLGHLQNKVSFQFCHWRQKAWLGIFSEFEKMLLIWFSRKGVKNVIHFLLVANCSDISKFQKCIKNFRTYLVAYLSSSGNILNSADKFRVILSVF